MVESEAGPKADRPRKSQCLESKSRKTPMSQFKDIQAGGILSDSGRVSLFALFRPSSDWIGLTTLGRAICFTQSTYLNH